MDQWINSQMIWGAHPSVSELDLLKAAERFFSRDAALNYFAVDVKLITDGSIKPIVPGERCFLVIIHLGPPRPQFSESQAV